MATFALPKSALPQGFPQGDLLWICFRRFNIRPTSPPPPRPPCHVPVDLFPFLLSWFFSASIHTSLTSGQNVHFGRQRTFKETFLHPDIVKRVCWLALQATMTLTHFWLWKRTAMTSGIATCGNTRYFAGTELGGELELMVHQLN